MKYETLTLKWTPRVKRIILLLILAVFMVGAVFGTAIGLIIGVSTNRASASSVTNVHEQADIVIETSESTTQTTTTTTPTKIYYDCPLSEDLQDYIRIQCEKNGLPMSLIIAMIEVESSFDETSISKSNDYGLMQINQINHEWLEEEYYISDFLNPYQNVLGGITIISQHYNRYCDLEKALMAYNLGATGAKRYWDKGIYTTAYTEKIIGAMERYEGRETNDTEV